MLRPPGIAVCRRIPSRGRLRPPPQTRSLQARPQDALPQPTPPPAQGLNMRPFSRSDVLQRPRLDTTVDHSRSSEGGSLQDDREDSGTDIGREFTLEVQPEPEFNRAEDMRRARTGPSSSPVEELDASATAVARVPLPEPLVVTPKRVRQPFDTHRFVSKLNAASIDPDVSRALMESVRGLITQRVDRAATNMLSKEELDNQAYLFKAALSKLRTEWNVRNRNTGIAGRNALSAIRRDLDGVELKMGEDVQMLKHDIELDMGNRKTDIRSDMKQTSINIQEINNRATISIGDLKTEIESAKWEATRRAIAIIVVLVVFGVVISTVTFGESKVPPVPKPDPAAHPASWTPAPTTRDIGVGSDEDSFDYEARIDKLLDKVERPERPEAKREPKRSRRSSKPEPFSEAERI